jgi:hypothetical protein
MKFLFLYIKSMKYTFIIYSKLKKSEIKFIMHRKDRHRRKINSNIKN